MIRRVVVAVLVGLLLAGQASAKGVATYVVITGPGIHAPIIVRGAAANPLGFSLMQITCATEYVCGSAVAPRHRGPAYTLTRDRFDRVRYYPNLAGGRGYIYYVGLLNGMSEYDRRWFRATAAGERALRHILVAHGVRLPA
jgi:hypothetical protein